MILKSSKPLEAKLCERKWGISLYALCSLQWGDTLFEDESESESESEWMELIFISVCNVCKCDFKIIFLQLCSIELRKKGSEAFNIFFVLKLMPNSSQYAKRSKIFGQKFSKTVLFVNELM